MPENKINAQQDGWTIRGYKAGDYYATIFCPHGRPVEVINTDNNRDMKGDQIYPRAELRQWMSETKDWHHNYCEGHTLRAERGSK